MRRWVVMTALLASACGEEPAQQPVLVVPPVAAGTAAPVAASVAPPVAAVATMPVAPPLPTPAGLLAVGQTRVFQAVPLFPATVLLANPSGETRTVALALDPPPGVKASPEPPAVPVATPTPAAAGEGSEFGFGFGGGSDWPRQPLTQRQVQALEAPRAFWINDGDATLEGDRLVPVQPRTGGPHLDVYVDAAATVGDDAVKRFVEAFEQRILPAEQPVFGSPRLAEGEKVAVVLSPWIGQAPGRSGMMGYFWPRDVMPRGGSGADLRQHSNERRVVFLSTALLDKPDVTALGTLAHEYQHLLMFDMKSGVDGTPHPEDTWLDEGCSMLAMDLSGYGLRAGDPFVAGEVAAFEKDPGAYSLTDWRGNPNGYSYGLSYMYLRYLVDRFGTGVIHELQATPLTGVEALQAVLAGHGTSFPEVFLAWSQTLVALPAPGAFDPAGTYGGVTLPGLQRRAPGEEASVPLRPWGLLPLSLESSGQVAPKLSVQALLGAVSVGEPGEGR